MAPLVAGLAIAMPAMALQIVCSPVTNAIGRPAIYLLTNVCGAVIMPACFLFGVAARDPLSFAIVPAILLIVAILAAFVPARRAAMIDPLKAMRG